MCVLFEGGFGWEWLIMRLGVDNARPPVELDRRGGWQCHGARWVDSFSVE